MYQFINKHITFLALFFFVSLWYGKAQDMAKADSSKNRIIRMDSVKFVADTGTIVRVKHSPSKAALFSAVLPGLGQIYNKKYWKLPIVYAGIGISGYYFIRNQRWYKDYLQGYIDYTNSGGDVSTIQNLDKIKNYTNKEAALKFYMNLYRRWRDWSVFFLAGTYFLNIIDATVDGYLFDYDISDNLSMKVEPVMFRPVVNTGTGSALGLKLSFNLH